MLEIRKNKIIDEKGSEVILRGYNLGNWLMLENFMLGFAGVEQQFRYDLEKHGGAEKLKYFSDRFLDAYIQEKDIEFLRKLGCNTVRIPFNYRHFESDGQPYTYNTDSFRPLDRVIALCKKHDIYVILDMHAIQGYQNEDWHSDNYTGEGRLYKDGCSRSRMEHLWKFIADYYKDNETVIGFDLINEPVALGEENIRILNSIYRNTVKAIREVNKKHIVFIKGNMWGQNFDGFDEPFDDRSVYSCHFYSDCALVHKKYPGREGEVLYDRGHLEREMDRRDEFTNRFNVPLWVGEFGVVYGEDYIEDKKRVLEHQLDIFHERGHSWSLWSYKDIGNMGTVYARPDSKWMQFIKEDLQLKRKYRCDFDPGRGGRWELLDNIREACKPDFPSDNYSTLELMLQKTLAATFADYLTERLTIKLASCTYDAMDELIDSFSFDHCLIRSEWADIIKKYMK